METGIVVCRKQFFGSVYLYNIVPAGLSKEWEPQVQLFEGRLCVCELMSKTDDMPWYQFKFDWEDRGIARQQEQNHFFGQTTLIKGTKDLNETVHSREEWYGVLMEYVGHQRLALELRIKDPREDQAFRDLLFRIQEEYEMIDEMMEDADFGECAG